MREKRGAYKAFVGKPVESVDGRLTSKWVPKK
jgi:hypothetical protein